MARPIDLELDGSVVWEAEDFDLDLVKGARYTDDTSPSDAILAEIVWTARRRGACRAVIDELDRRAKIGRRRHLSECE